MPDIILLKITAWGILFLTMCLVTGRSVPDAWLFPQLSRPLQLTLIGFSILVIVLRFSFREHTPIIFGFSILIILGVTGLIRFVVEVRKTRNPVSVVTRLRQERLGLPTADATCNRHPIFSIHEQWTMFFKIAARPRRTLLSAAFVFDGNSYPDFFGLLRKRQVALNGGITRMLIGTSRIFANRLL